MLSSKRRVGTWCRPGIKRHECTSTAAVLQGVATKHQNPMQASISRPSIFDAEKSWCSGKLGPNPCRPCIGCQSAKISDGRTPLQKTSTCPNFRMQHLPKLGEHKDVYMCSRNMAQSLGRSKTTNNAGIIITAAPCPPKFCFRGEKWMQTVYKCPTAVTDDWNRTVYRFYAINQGFPFHLL